MALYEVGIGHGCKYRRQHVRHAERLSPDEGAESDHGAPLARARVRQLRRADPGQAFEEGRAALDDVAVCGIEVAGVPGIGDIAGATGPIEQARDLAVGVFAKDAAQSARILGVHIDDVVPVGILRATHLAGAMGDDGNPDFA